MLLFENVRELLFNVVKHAKVNDALVTLHYTEAQVTISVEDAGCGFAGAIPASTDPATSLGLHSVRNRVVLLGGYMDIQSIPNIGTCVILSLPL